MTGNLGTQPGNIHALPFCVLAIAMLFLVNTVHATTETDHQGNTQTHLSSSDQTDAIQQNLEQLLTSVQQSGRFEQQRYLAVLDAPLISKGTFSIDKQHGLLWSVESPFAIEYAYDGKTLSQTEFGEASIIGLKQDPALVGFFSFFYDILQGNTQDLNSLFKLETDQSHPYAVRLTPQQRFLKKSFEYIRIELIEDTIKQITIVETTSDKVVLLFFPDTHTSP